MVKESRDLSEEEEASLRSLEVEIKTKGIKFRTYSLGTCVVSFRPAKQAATDGPAHQVNTHTHTHTITHTHTYTHTHSLSLFFSHTHTHTHTQLIERFEVDWKLENFTRGIDD